MGRVRILDRRGTVHRSRTRTAPDLLVRLATAYDDARTDGDDEAITFEMPEDLSGIDDAALAALQAQATEAFDAIYDADRDPSADEVATMQALADASDAIRAEQASRDEQREQNREAAEALAARVRPVESTDDEDTSGDEGQTLSSETSDDDGERETVAASGGQPRRITVSGVARRQGGRRQPADPQRPTLVAAADLGGVSAGEQVTVDQVAEQLIRRTQGMTDASYRHAFSSGRRQRNSIGLLSVVKNFPAELVASMDNGQEVVNRAVDQARLPGGSLVASGGWCSPSETVYDLFEVETADGLISVPEFQVVRGGIRYTQGPDFASLYANAGFTFTEEDDIDGLYGVDGEGEPTEGDKPCFKVDCPEFVDERLQVTGVCITAGLLQNRAYPELTARTIRGALVAHQHRLAAQTISAMAADSTAVAMPADQVGAAAPVLTAIELQATHYRYVHRMGDNAVLEAVFPRWVRGVIRSDLSRRLGVDLLSVTNAQIAAWFAERQINPQFVYNYQDITGNAAAFTAWPTEVSFLLYAAGTWTRGSSDVISLDAIFDSALLKQNDFTALFTEEGWLLAQRGHDSREVTVEVCGSGATHGGVLIDCEGAGIDAGE
jgi:hypothetical protein